MTIPAVLGARCSGAASCRQLPHCGKYSSAHIAQFQPNCYCLGCNQWQQATNNSLNTDFNKYYFWKLLRNTHKPINNCLKNKKLWSFTQHTTTMRIKSLAVWEHSCCNDDWEELTLVEHSYAFRWAAIQYFTFRSSITYVNDMSHLRRVQLMLFHPKTRND